MTSLDQVRSETTEFFGLHWPQEWGPAPQWSDRWDLTTGSKDNERAGCYLLIDSKGALVYIGKASQRSSDGSLARRLLGHVIRPIRRGGPYEIKIDKWPTVTDIHTLAFEEDRAYLAVSLEAFLIRRLKPERNCAVS